MVIKLTYLPFRRFSKTFHEPGSGGLLNLPFQRPIETCRKFSSKIIDSVISNISSTVRKHLWEKKHVTHIYLFQIENLDLAQLFTNSFPNTLDTTVAQTTCLTGMTDPCVPLAYIITGDINAMWLRDSANQILPYIDYIKQDFNLKRLFLGAIYMQAQFLTIHPYSNAFKEPTDIHALSQTIFKAPIMDKRAMYLQDGGKTYCLIVYI